jgi:patatin-like phospholipase/acyl hydrolase
VLAELEKLAGGAVARHFDLVAGTSVGGILALGLAAEIPAVDMKAAFERRGTDIFSRRPVPRSGLGKLWDLTRSALTPKYGAAALRATIEEFLGAERLLGDLPHRVIVPAVNLTKGKPQVFKTPHHETFKRDLHLRAVDVAMATSAAPTFFPIAEIGDELFADGGLYANSPDILALHEATHFLGADPGAISVLSVGTTTSQFSFSHVGGLRLGIIPWMKGQKLVQVILSSQQASVDYMLRHRLGDRYVRVDELQSKEQERELALDVATEDAQRTIRALAEASVRYLVNNPVLQAMLAQRASPPKFFLPPTWKASSER